MSQTNLTILAYLMMLMMMIAFLKVILYYNFKVVSYFANPHDLMTGLCLYRSTVFAELIEVKELPS
jgi:hypothetical protein